MDTFLIEESEHIVSKKAQLRCKVIASYDESPTISVMGELAGLRMEIEVDKQAFPYAPKLGDTVFINIKTDD